jgi:DNA-binding GntR family transcriptional regulator
MSNQVFEIVQAMSGQGNCITIPGPYLDFFAGDRQQHLLAAILNQLVFWSGKSSLDDGWFYKEHAALAKEIRAKDGDVVRKAMFKITDQYLSGVIEKSFGR